MKQVSAFFLAISILLQASTPALWVLDYQLRKAAYVKHCENKSKSDLKCDGKCYLKKQIQANDTTDPKEPRLPEHFYSIKNLNLYCEALDILPDPAAIRYGFGSLFPPYLRYQPDAPVSRYFKPPAAA